MNRAKIAELERIVQKMLDRLGGDRGVADICVELGDRFAKILGDPERAAECYSVAAQAMRRVAKLEQEEATQRELVSTE